MLKAMARAVALPTAAASARICPHAGVRREWFALLDTDRCQQTTCFWIDGFQRLFLYDRRNLFEEGGVVGVDRVEHGTRNVDEVHRGWVRSLIKRINTEVGFRIFHRRAQIAVLDEAAEEHPVAVGS